MITVICYGTKHEFKTKKAAIDFFTEGTWYCDPNSSECCRYNEIISRILCGETFINSDEY